jgi:hypothetical protein
MGSPEASVSLSACGTSKDCPAGTYLSSNFYIPCQRCPENTYNDATGAQDETACIRCPQDLFAPKGSTSLDDCKADVTPEPTAAPTEVPSDFDMDLKVTLENDDISAEKFLESDDAMDAVKEAINDIMYNPENPDVQYSVESMNALDVAATSDDDVGGSRRRLQTPGAIDVEFKLQVSGDTDAGASIPQNDEVSARLTSAVNTGDFADSMTVYGLGTEVEGATASNMQEYQVSNQDTDPVEENEKSKNSKLPVSYIIGGIAAALVVGFVLYWRNRNKNHEFEPAEQLEMPARVHQI